MKFTSFTHIPKSRAQFEHHLHILEHKLQGGTLRISAHMESSTTGLRKVRYSPNRRLNLLTVDEFVRNMANTLANSVQTTPLQSKSNKSQNENE